MLDSALAADLPSSILKHKKVVLDHITSKYSSDKILLLDELSRIMLFGDLKLTNQSDTGAEFNTKLEPYIKHFGDGSAYLARIMIYNIQILAGDNGILVRYLDSKYSTAFPSSPNEILHLTYTDYKSLTDEDYIASVNYYKKSFNEEMQFLLDIIKNDKS